MYGGAQYYTQRYGNDADAASALLSNRAKAVAEKEVLHKDALGGSAKRLLCLFGNKKRSPSDNGG